jgi:hypothetical protein
MMQWVTYVILGLVLIVSTARGEDDVGDVASGEYGHSNTSWKLDLNCVYYRCNEFFFKKYSALSQLSLSVNGAKTTRSKDQLTDVLLQSQVHMSLHTVYQASSSARTANVFHCLLCVTTSKIAMAVKTNNKTVVSIQFIWVNQSINQTVKQSINQFLLCVYGVIQSAKTTVSRANIRGYTSHVTQYTRVSRTDKCVMVIRTVWMVKMKLTVVSNY